MARRPASAAAPVRRGPQITQTNIWQYGADVEIPLSSGAVGAVPGIVYAPRRQPEQILIMAPGSNGGMGPGVDVADRGLPLTKRTSRAARNSIYARLGASFASGVNLDFDGEPMGEPMGRENGQNGQNGPICACLQISWRHCVGGVAWPKRRLKHLRSLQIAADDVVAAVSFMRDRYGPLPVVLIGFSFGGPAVWAAALRCEVQGVVALASSARGGQRFEQAGLDTEAGVRAMVHRSTPVLWLHGLADRNVDPAVTAHFSAIAEKHQEAAATTSNLTVCMVRACGHMFDCSRILAYQVLRAWLISEYGGPPLPHCLGLEVEPMLRQDGGFAPKGNRRLKLLLSSRARAEVLDLPEVNRDKLRKKHVKGYSE
ncbi:unnamed protein product [Symbiodinium natans]|uniref:Peptidase S9 prolyl oligopeptidase catalytic domain-containing protein n=1 Tax=Symbiodinium natans TaxID=878477 RepID=A0A812PCT0_9DINO|nr:unnamed protein product [Symbiodinium natans]